MVNGHKASAPGALDDKVGSLPAGDQFAAAAPDIRSPGRRNTFLHVAIPMLFSTAPERPTTSEPQGISDPLPT